MQTFKVDDPVIVSCASDRHFIFDKVLENYFNLSILQYPIVRLSKIPITGAFTSHGNLFMFYFSKNVFLELCTISS